MLAHRDALAGLLSREQGKPLAEARGEVAYAASFLEWFAEEAKRSYGECLARRTVARSDQHVDMCQVDAGSFETFADIKLLAVRCVHHSPSEMLPEINCAVAATGL
jgi:hypothetical protein